MQARPSFRLPMPTHQPQEPEFYQTQQRQQPAKSFISEIQQSIVRMVLPILQILLQMPEE